MIKDRIQLLKGDITQMQVDAIVNAANTSLMDGAGVNGAIHEAAGEELEAACIALGGCQTGNAKITKGYKLPAKHIIHAVGPVWRGGAKGESKLLAAVYHESLKLALDNQIKTIAFPSISCGIFGYPISQAAVIAVNEVANFLEMHTEVEKVYFVCFDDACLEAYQYAIESLYNE